MKFNENLRNSNEFISGYIKWVNLQNNLYLGNQKPQHAVMLKLHQLVARAI